MDNQNLVFLGGAVKALGEGRISGYLVLFGSPEQTDVSAARDFFTPQTDFGLDGEGAKTAVWYRHGLDAKLDRKLADGELKVDDVGVWVEGVLDLRDRYQKALYGLAESEKLGWSSGTASHLVRRKKHESKGGGVAHEITRWPLGLDASLTPDPAEPRTQALAIKSVQWLAPPLDELVPELAAKSEFLDEYVEKSMTMAAISRLNDALMYGLVFACCEDEVMTIGEKLAKLGSGFDEFRDIALRTFRALLDGTGAEEAGDAMKAVRALWSDPAGDRTGVRLPAGLTLEQHSAAVLVAVEGLANRAREVKSLRAEKGRDLTEVRRAEALTMSRLLAEIGTPAPETKTTDAKDAARLETERLRTRFLRLTSPATRLAETTVGAS